MDWLRKPAIQWSAEFTPTNDASTSAECCPYWNQEVIALLSSLNTLCDNECSISYEALLVSALAIVRNLRQRLSEMVFDELENVHHDSTPSRVGASVVVAIPEGPFLPLAILVVQLLNEPIMTTAADESQTNAVPFAVLVPLESAEGKERLRHQLDDLQPSIIFCLSEKDSDKVSEVLSCIQPRKTTITDEGLLLAARPSLQDFCVLVRDAIENMTPTELVRIRTSLADRVDELNNQQTFFQALSKCQQGLIAASADDSLKSKELSTANRVSHIVFTSGTTGVPKGCVSSIQALRHYLTVKNEAHEITTDSKVLLASALSFDPCLSDILATFSARATLVICSRAALIQNLATVLKQSHATHILCTPTLWGMLHGSGARPTDLPSLQVVALGGEAIPKHIVKMWARDKRLKDNKTRLRLCATYGVTEACVYQTFGEVWQEEDNNNDCSPGQNVGKPLRGLAVRIRETNNCGKEEMTGVGEVVLQGKQIDEYSCYLNKEQLSREKFFKASSTREQSGGSGFGGEEEEEGNYCYSTGDRGCIDSATNDVYILGRIDGEDGMVKVNGVRVELGEIENALIDGTLVTACLAVDREMDGGLKQIHTFCVLSPPGLLETGLNSAVECECGVVLAPCPLLLLLRARCAERVRAGVVPSTFIIIKRLPLSPTGKRDRRRLPRVSDCVYGSNDNSTPLWEYGSSGATVAQQIVDCLNLQSYQRHLVTTDVRFGELGGDSLAATRVVRSLYAHHHHVLNSRLLGGKYGTLDGPFTVSHLLRAKSMGDYVDWLDSHGLCGATAESNGNVHVENDETERNDIVKKDVIRYEKDESFRLYESLLQAATSGQTCIACSLLDLGVDPNADDHGGRLGKTSGGNVRKRIFHSNPLHLACIKGDAVLVKKLIEKGCKLNSPDAAGSFPIHLAASSTNNSNDDDSVNSDSKDEEDHCRCECVKSLLEAGAPLTMKDSNKQTVLHCAARAGHCKLLRYLLQRWSNVGSNKDKNKHASKLKTGPHDWRDRWFRTPVHWAVLNGKVEALAILLDGGCTPDPPKPKASSNRQTSAAIESPLQICERLYGGSDTGKHLSAILLGHYNRESLTGSYPTTLRYSEYSYGTSR